MASSKERIKQLEEEVQKTKYNKATQHHIGLVKAKIAMLKAKEESRVSKKTGKSDHGYDVKKSGDATVLLLGFPSAGKSTLLNKLAGTESEVGAYAFTTLGVIPGMLHYKQAKIQILDVPGIVSGAASGRGRGKEVLAVIRNADLVLIVIDATAPQHYKAILREVREAHIRINKTKPEVYIKKTAKDGILLGKTVKLDISDETIKRVLQEFRLNNAQVLIRSKIDIDEFIDVIEGNKKYLPAVTILSKSDLVDSKELEAVKKKVSADIAISAHKNINIEALKEMIFERLHFMRIYMKEPRKEADMKEPMIIRRGSTIEDVCAKTHRDFVKNFKIARVWGTSAKFPGQRLTLRHELQDGDIVELHMQ